MAVSKTNGADGAKSTRATGAENSSSPGSVKKENSPSVFSEKKALPTTKQVSIYKKIEQISVLVGTMNNNLKAKDLASEAYGVADNYDIGIRSLEEEIEAIKGNNELSAGEKETKIAGKKKEIQRLEAMTHSQVDALFNQIKALK